MLCESCQKNKSSISAVRQGKLLHVCVGCRDVPVTSSGHARWARSIDAEDHEADLQQPYNPDGSVNPKFAKLYPDKAKYHFNDKQLRDAELKG